MKMSNCSSLATAVLLTAGFGMSAHGGDCTLATPTGFEAELCGESTNGGCNSTGTPTENIALGNVIQGTFWANENTRDTDWYRFTLNAPTEVTISLRASEALPAFAAILSVCGGDLLGGGTTTGSCPETYTVCLPAGSYLLVALPEDFTGSPCGGAVSNDYTIGLSGTPCTLPPGSTCDDPAAVIVGENAFANGITENFFDISGICNPGPGEDDTIYNTNFYSFTPAVSGRYTFSTCGAANFNTRMAITTGCNDAFATIACNQDGTGCTGEGSTIPNLLLEGGTTYFVALGGATSDTFVGSGTLTISVVPTCVLDTSTANEGEACGENTNGGCNSTPNATTPIAVGDTVEGTLWADAGVRDLDWYTLTVTQKLSVTVSVKSDEFTSVSVLAGACGATTTLSSGFAACGATATACLNPGTYLLVVGSVDSSGNARFEGLPCGSGLSNEYTIRVTGEPSSCTAPLIPGACVNPGPDTVTINSAETTPNGIVRCASQPAFPNCSVGYSTQNSYARTFAAGSIGGQIQCVRLGLFAVRRAVNTAGNACALFLSDIPLPATVGIYRDIDGGAPRIRGAGGDLVEIDSRAVLMAGQAGVSPVNYDPPLCVEDFSNQSIVVVVDFPSTQFGDNGVPANVGYQMLVAGNSVDAGSQTYCQLGPCDANPEFKLTESLGAAFTQRWYVAVNGDFDAFPGGCAPPCPADLTDDGQVNGSDITALLAAWGTSNPAADLNSDGNVNGSDLTALLAGWGACP